jgi:hypothetical protein
MIDTVGPHNSHMFWQPFRHGCGCYLEWGTPIQAETDFHVNVARHGLTMFLQGAKNYPCPQHGSSTGVPGPPLKEFVPVYMRACQVWYRACHEDQKVYADRLSESLGVPDIEVTVS